MDIGADFISFTKTNSKWTVCQRPKYILCQKKYRYTYERKDVHQNVIKKITHKTTRDTTTHLTE